MRTPINPDSLSSAPAELKALGTSEPDKAAESARVASLVQKRRRLMSASDRLKTLEPADRKSYEQRLNVVKSALEDALLKATGRIS